MSKVGIEGNTPPLCGGEIYSRLRWLLKSDSLTKSLTFKKMLIELRKIKSVAMSDNSERLIPLTKLQKTILNSLGVDSDLLYE